MLSNKIKWYILALNLIILLGTLTGCLHADLGNMAR